MPDEKVYTSSTKAVDGGGEEKRGCSPGVEVCAVREAFLRALRGRPCGQPSRRWGRHHTEPASAVQ